MFTQLSLCPRERENLQSYVDAERAGTGSSTRCPSAFMLPGQAGSAEQLSSSRQLHQDFNIFKAFFCVYLRKKIDFLIAVPAGTSLALFVFTVICEYCVLQLVN